MSDYIAPFIILSVPETQTRLSNVTSRTINSAKFLFIPLLVYQAGSFLYSFTERAMRITLAIVKAAASDQIAAETPYCGMKK